MNEQRFQPGSARDLIKDGCWLKDAQGRFVLLRGVNFGARTKLPPYLPIMPLHIPHLDSAEFHKELAAVQPDLDQLKQLGFNVVRLLVMWKALEPRPNPNLDQLLPEGVQYLELVREVIDALWARGLYVIVDFHQDIAHEVYGGDGFPDWAMAIDGSHQRPRFSPPNNPRWGLYYYHAPLTPLHLLIRHTLRSFWQNDLYNIELSKADLTIARPVRTHLEKTIGATARFFQALEGGQGHPAILGYEPFNEPHPIGIPRQEFERDFLPRYYENVLREIRSPSATGQPGDPRAFLFVEPRMDWTTYAIDGPEFHETQFTRNPETFLDVSSLDADRLIFAFHYYDPWTLAKAAQPSPFFPYRSHGDDMRKKAEEWPDVFRRIGEAAASRGLVSFMTEFGGSQDWLFPIDLPQASYQNQQIRAYMDLQFQQVEAQRLNATYWNYDLYNTVEGKDNWNQENFSLLGPNRSERNLDIVTRPYPMRSSAEPAVLFFDLETKHAAIVMKGPVVEAPTVIFVPRLVHYGSGFEVRATSSQVQWDRDSNLLTWMPDRGQSLQQLVINPAGAFDPEHLPESSRLLLPRTTFHAVFTE